MYTIITLQIRSTMENNSFNERTKLLDSEINEQQIINVNSLSCKFCVSLSCKNVGG